MIHSDNELNSNFLLRSETTVVLCVGCRYSPTCLDCVFDAKEQNFSRTMGHFWTNLAASGDPNRRNAGTPGGEADGVWPTIDRGNILLQPLVAPYTPETMKAEVGMQEGKDAK